MSDMAEGSRDYKEEEDYQHNGDDDDYAEDYQDEDDNDGRQQQGGDQQIDDGICRDFLRNVCRRGARCRYKHPNKAEAQEMGLAEPDYIFCHDYQNSACRRVNCKFIHCTREEEEHFHLHGSLPERLADAVENNIPLNEPLTDDDIPICKDYLKGACNRATRCKFRHLTMREYERDVERKARRRAAFDPPGGPALLGGGPSFAKRGRMMEPPHPNVPRGHPMQQGPPMQQPMRGPPMRHGPLLHEAPHGPPVPQPRGGHGAPMPQQHLPAPGPAHVPSPAPAPGYDRMSRDALVEENIMLKERLENVWQQYTSLLKDREVYLHENRKLGGDGGPHFVPINVPL